MFTRDKYLATTIQRYDVYFYVKSDTKVQNKVFDGDALIQLIREHLKRCLQVV